MTPSTPRAELDHRFGDAGAEPTPWPEAQRVLGEAELYWLTTVRRDGRPHVTPLIGVWHDGAMHFCTGRGSQKARNLLQQQRMALTTGTNAWAEGLDLVVEGTAVPVTDRPGLQGVADAYEAKYGSRWHFDVGDGDFGSGDNASVVFRVAADKVLAFAKQPHAQTRYRFSAG